jgi:hypothetical protein
MISHVQIYFLKWENFLKSLVKIKTHA